MGIRPSEHVLCDFNTLELLHKIWKNRDPDYGKTKIGYIPVFKQVICS